MWPCIVTNFFLMKPTDALIFPNLFLSRKSIYFGQFLCPLSGVLHCTFGTGICHARLMTAFKHVQDGTAVPSWTYIHKIKLKVNFISLTNFGEIPLAICVTEKLFDVRNTHSDEHPTPESCRGANTEYSKQYVGTETWDQVENQHRDLVIQKSVEIEQISSYCDSHEH